MVKGIEVFRKHFAVLTTLSHVLKATVRLLFDDSLTAITTVSQLPPHCFTPVSFRQFHFCIDIYN